MQKPLAALKDPAKPKYKAIAPDTMWTRLWYRLRCAPSRPGATKPAIPTSTKTTPRSLQTVFAMISFVPPVNCYGPVVTHLFRAKCRYCYCEEVDLERADCTPNRRHKGKLFGRLKNKPRRACF